MSPQLGFTILNGDAGDSALQTLIEATSASHTNHRETNLFIFSCSLHGRTLAGGRGIASTPIWQNNSIARSKHKSKRPAPFDVKTQPKSRLKLQITVGFSVKCPYSGGLSCRR
jgi:hypothetical protein